MLRKSVFPAVTAVLVSLLMAVQPVGAGFVLNATVSASTPTSITAGQSVTFQVALDCNSAWDTYQAQLFNGSQSSPLGSSVTLTGAGLSNSVTVTGTVTVTFTSPGTYQVGASISNGLYQSSATSACDLVISSGLVTVTVAAPPTTTTAPTTTVPLDTTTTAEVLPDEPLPATGGRTSEAMLALLLAGSGLAIMRVRRRFATTSN